MSDGTHCYFVFVALCRLSVALLSMHSQLILYVHQASQRAESGSICNFKCEHSDSAPGAPAGSTAARPDWARLRSHIHRTWAAG
jgi:hypothetical protein